MYPITHKSFRIVYRDIVYLKTIHEAHVSMTRRPSCKENVHLPYLELSEECDVGADIVTGYGLHERRGWNSSPGRVKNFLHVVQTD
jgi:hypothetical protein